VNLDLMPARVQRPEGSYVTENCRVVITGDAVVVHREWVGEPETWPYSSVLEYDRARTLLKFQTSAGVLQVSRGHGCGCGSPLRRIDTPW
jgi:hypothetical protein